MFSPMRRGAKLPMKVLALALAAWIVTGAQPLLMGEGAVEAAGMAVAVVGTAAAGMAVVGTTAVAGTMAGVDTTAGTTTTDTATMAVSFLDITSVQAITVIQAMVTVMAPAIPSRITIRAMRIRTLSTPTIIRFIPPPHHRRGDILASTSKS